MWIQLIISLFVAFVLFRLFRNYLHRKISRRILVLWSVLWIGVLIVFWSPETASRLAVFFGIGRGADLIVYSAIIVIVYLLYRIFIRLEKFDRDITVLTRNIALKDDGKGKHTSSNTDNQL